MIVVDNGKSDSTIRPHGRLNALDREIEFAFQSKQLTHFSLWILERFHFRWRQISIAECC
jgi:hypothetical protein